jgi:glycosyltransferase involved in cell wall biosynthesis
VIGSRRRSAVRVAINARFATIPVTGVQRYARELLGELAGAGAVDAVAIVPPGELVELDGRDWLMSRPPTDRWSGGRGHLWEQATLPGLVRRARADLLLSPCNWGPMAMRRQLPIFHDTAPLFHPEYFVPSYARWARIVTSRLVRSSVRSAATCARVRDELVRFAGASPESVDVVPPGVGPPFTDYDIDPGRAPSPRCVFVGGHDVRKNLAFLTSFWGPVHAELGLALDVVGRSWTSTRRVDHPMDGQVASTPGVRFHVDVDDAALARLLAGALCLLWPSHYEGYGLPLLEAMAVGTPFLSSDTGAARELAISGEQVLPLHQEAWIAQLRRWCEHQPAELRAASMARARAATWTRSSAALLEAIERAAHR